MSHINENFFSKEKDPLLFARTSFAGALPEKVLKTSVDPDLIKNSMKAVGRLLIFKKVHVLETKIISFLQIVQACILDQISEEIFVTNFGAKKTDFGFITDDNIELRLVKKYIKINKHALAPFIDGVITVILGDDNVVVYSYYLGSERYIEITKDPKSFLIQKLEEEYNEDV